MMGSSYQTFEGQPLIRTDAPANDRTINNRRYPSCARLMCFGLFLTVIALAAIGPITFVVAMIRLKFFPPPGTSTTSPPTFRSQRKVFLLQIEPKVVSYPEAGPDCFYHVYSYGGTLPGPSIYVEPGMTINVEVTNNLGPDHRNTTRLGNEYRFPNTTTTHFHGLHISPTGKSDNVFAEIAPGDARTYTLAVRPNHPAGTYYVHPHLHGSTAMQTGFAMSAPMVVQDIDIWWRSLPEDIFTVQMGGLDSGHTYSDARLAFKQNEAPEQVQTTKCNPIEFILVNGAIGGRETVCDELIRRWRIINAATDGGLVLRLKGDRGCRARLVARDGVYLAEGVPKVVRASDIFVVPPGGRIDFLVQQRQPSQVCQLVSEPQDRITNSLGPKTKLVASVIATCVPPINPTELADEQRSAMGVFPTSLPGLPGYMDDLRQYPKAERRVLEWTEFNTQFRNGDAKYGINGEPFTLFSRFSVRLDRIQEWIIVNALAGDGGPAVESHPFHLHTNHFQIVGSSGNALNNEDYVAGQWRDTVYVPTPGNLTIRWIPRHYTGQSLLHCHTLSHEDRGMSWTFDIIDRI